MTQRKDIYRDLRKALMVMRYIDEKTPKNRVFYAMWLLETRSLASGTNIYVSKRYHETCVHQYILILLQREATFPLIAEVIIESLEVSDVESYFLSRNFYKFSEEIARDLPKLKLLTSQMLEKEDSDLYK